MLLSLKGAYSLNKKRFYRRNIIREKVFAMNYSSICIYIETLN